MTNVNSLQKVQFREQIRQAEQQCRELIAIGQVPDITSLCTIKHFFVPAPGGYIYTREVFLPADSVIFGKIHRYECVNYVMQGTIVIATETGVQHFAAPCIFISGPGMQKAGWVKQDTLWATSHFTRTNNPDEVEAELIVKTYAELGLIDTVKYLPQETKYL